MAMAVGASGGPNANMNVTPLIDVLLVLLIIFMVITPLTPKGSGCAGSAAAAQGPETAAAADRSHHRGAVDRSRTGAAAGVEDQSG